MSRRRAAQRVLAVGASLAAFAQSAAAQDRAECGEVVPAVVARVWPAPLDRTITLHAHGIPLRDALGRLAAAARIRLSYSAELLPLDRRVCLAHDGGSAGEALAALLGGISVEPRVVSADHVVLAPGAPRLDVTTSSTQSAPTLERVVVTGSAMGAARRELAIALNVLDGRTLEREASSGSLASILDGSVPAVWVWEQSPSSALTRFGSIRGASSFGASYPKVYLDGIEVANPLVLSYVSPEMVERIEVIRGPQGAALYGTDAISGVINVITRADGVGRDGGWASARSQAGAAQSDFSNAGGGGGGAFSQLNSISLRGGSSSRSGGIAATVKGIGAFVPDAFSRQVSATGGGRLVGAKGILTGTARFFAQDAGAPLSPLLADTTFGMLDSTSLAQQLSPRTQSVRQYTFGATGNVVAGERWTHAATLGLDGYRLAGVDDDLIPIPTVADAGVRAAHSSGDRATLRVSSVTQQPVGKQALLGLTFAAEHSVLFERSDEPAMVAWQPGAPVRPALADVSSSWSNSGLIAQANLSLRDTWYFSAGARAERNGGFDVEQTTLLPMLGAAWVHELAGATVKLRSAFGKGIRPQRTATRESTWVGTHRHGTARSLAPEEQSGIEAGIDVFLGRALSLQVTRFDQLASGLIQRVTLGADTSARSRRGPRAIGYAMQNVGEITNRGWELEGGVRAGALTLNGTLALVDSRVRQTAAGYSGDLRAGDRMLEVPSRTTSLSARWTRSGWNLSAGATRAADWINYDRLGLAWAVVNGEHPEPQYIGGWLRGFWDTYDGVTRVRASITRDIGRNLSLQLSGDNLLGEQLGEPDNVTVLPGRLISLGVRLQR